MKVRGRYFIVLIVFFCLLCVFSCRKTEESLPEETQQPVQQEATPEELTASVPELRDLHEVVYPLWHSAFPDKDYDLIKELLPQAITLIEKLDEAKLPGILRDKQEAWIKGKEELITALDGLKQAVESEDQQEMLNQVEAFHAGFERLVRTIRPVIPELEAFHKEMYKLYHYSIPNYDLENVRIDVKAMQEKLIALKEAQLPERQAEKQSAYEAAVGELEDAVNELAELVKKGEKDMILEAIERAHTAYQNTEYIFN